MMRDVALGGGIAVTGIVIAFIYEGPEVWLGVMIVVAGLIVALGPIWGEIR